MARMPFFNRFEKDTCNTIDDVSGFKTKLSRTSKRWDGYMVARENYEERQPQDFPVAPRSQQVYSNARPQQPIKVYTPPNPEDL